MPSGPPGENSGVPHAVKLPGYEDILQQQLKKQGFQLRQNDHVETQCWVWKHNHGWKVWNDEGDEFWMCKLCHKSSSPEQYWFRSSKSTSRVKLHMREEHGINAKGAISSSLTREKKRKLDKYMSEHDTVVASRGTSIVPVNPFNFRRSFLQCVIAGHIALGGLGAAPLRQVVECANPQARLPSLETVKEWITKAYDRQLSVVARMLSSATSKVSLSFNFSTRGSSHRLLGVVAHFIVRDGKRTSVLVILPRQGNMPGTYNSAEMVTAIITKHNLEKSLGYVVTDDTSCDTARIPASTFDHLPAAKYWNSCPGRILAQVARTVLFGSDADSLDRELIGTRTDELRRMDAWRRRGPCGKLRNIIAYFENYHPQWEERFEHDQCHAIASAMPGTKIDVFEHLEHDDTGWEVMGDLIARALYLRPVLSELMDKEIGDHHTSCHDRSDASLPLIADDRLAPHDWQVLKAYHDILQRIKEAKVILQGQSGCCFGAIWQVLPQFDALLTCLEESRQRQFLHDERQATSPGLQSLQPKEAAPKRPAVQEYVMEVHNNNTAPLQNAESQKQSREHSRIAATHRFDAGIDRAAVGHQFYANINTGWQRVHDYCETLHVNVLYVAAVVLHPRIKWRYFEAKWRDRKDRLSNCVSALNRHWRDKYKDKAVDPRSLGEEMACGNERAADEWSDDGAWDPDQFEEYQTEQADRSYGSTESPVEYWAKRKKMWPQLSAMALDIYSVPVFANVPELVFNRASKACPAEQQQLDDDTLACLMCLRIWQSSGTLEIDDDLFEGTDVMPDG